MPVLGYQELCITLRQICEVGRVDDEDFFSKVSIKKDIINVYLVDIQLP